MSAAPDAAQELSLLAATLDKAAARLPVAPRLYRVAGDLVAIRVGDRAAALLEAFTPIRVSGDDGAIALEVFIFDSVSDKLALPETGITHRQIPQPGGLGACAAPGAQAFFQPDAGVLSLFDASRRRAYCWLRDSTALPYYEFAAPLRHLLQWWMLSRGGALLHSAAVGTHDGGVLIAGTSGSGKSTTALACQEAGLGFTSDDYVLISLSGPTVHMAYSTAKVVRESLGAHDAYRRHFRNLARNDEKPMMFMHEVAPQRVLRSFPLRAIVVPVIVPRSSTRIVAAGAAEVLRALAPSSILLFPLAGATAFQRIAALCRVVPCLRAELSGDPHDVAGAFARLLRDGTTDGVAAAA